MGQYSPPVIYKKWWKEIQKCTGLKVPKEAMETVTWAYVRADAFGFGPDSTDWKFAGYSFTETNTIVVLWKGMLDSTLIKHEMTHFLMWHNGIEAGHPDEYFKKCHTY